jgi:beta-glucosidase
MKAGKNPKTQSIEQQVGKLLGQMTLKEKASLLAGRNTWSTAAIERLGIPSITLTDGPHGVRPSQPEEGRICHPATGFPTGVSMAATWNPALIKRVGGALGEETRAMRCDILLGPCVNIVRTPVAGRNFETYAEDPFLAGAIGTAWVDGVQGQGVGTSLKHFACNNQETERFQGSSEVDERTLREIYLPAFETIVKNARPWTVMCSYNRINGTYASEHDYLLNRILREEWGFEGIVISDWGATHSTVDSVKGGLDIEMPGPARYRGDHQVASAVRTWQLEQEDVDRAVRRILGMIVRSGRIRSRRAAKSGSVNTAVHQKLARVLAEEAIVLLKNDRTTLPLDTDRLKSVAVIGPNAVDTLTGGGGSSRLESPYAVSILDGLKRTLGRRATVTFDQGCDNYVDPPLLKPSLLTTEDGETQGLNAAYFDNAACEGTPVVQRTDGAIDFWWGHHGPVKGISAERFSVRWTGTFTAPATGPHAFTMVNTGTCRMWLDGRKVLENKTRRQNGHFDAERASKLVRVNLTAGRRYRLKIEFAKTSSEPFGRVKLLLSTAYGPGEDRRIKAAARRAASADAAIVVVGMPEYFETEGCDRRHLDLPGRQNELVGAVARANPNTVVVVNAGAPVAMPWIDEVAAAVDVFYPGMEGGNAVARVLTGAVNPSGKLPATFPRRYQDNPAFINHPGTREVRYGEGIFVGYRYYDKKEIEPLFPFGHGLSYTSFAYSRLTVPKKLGSVEHVPVSVRVKNTGKLSGKETVQLYVRDIESTLARPVKELKAFAKVALDPGKSATVTFELDQRSFSYYDPYGKGWTVEPGKFEILVGSSSRDIRLRTTLAVA